MSARLALLLIGLLCAAGLLVAGRGHVRAAHAAVAERACPCASPDCDCIGVCVCERVSCCATGERLQPFTPARIELAARPADPPAAPADPAGPRLRRKGCGSHGELPAAGSSGGPSGIARPTAAPAVTRVHPTYSPAPVEQRPTTRRPAPPSPPPERAVA